MEKTNNARNYSQRAFLKPSGYVLKDGYVTIFLGDQVATRVHENYLKKILGIKFVSITKNKKEVA